MSTETSSKEWKTKFSIFDPVITYEHREFYEKIVNELNGLFPICNQGKCSAVEISEDATEQEQITDLMVRVENFSVELLEVTKKLFDQFYQAKEEFYCMILSNVAYVKINLIDRNLLERTCDVRWWALERAFGECIILTNQTKGNIRNLNEKLRILLEKLNKSIIDGSLIQPERAHLLEALKKLMPHFCHSGIQLIISDNNFSAFSQDIGELEKILHNNKESASLYELITKTTAELQKLHTKIKFSCQRLEDINSSYTLYRDLVICDKEGYIIANANRARRQEVLGLNVSDEKWFDMAMRTKDGTEYFAQDFTGSKVEDIPSLIYTTAIRENCENNGDIIGAMGVYFDFQGEASIIMKDYMPTDEAGNISSGWNSFITSEDSTIIGTSDESIFELGHVAHLPRSHRALEPGHKIHSYAIVEGQNSAIFSAKTDGYLEYDGLGWSSHLIVPRHGIFGNKYQTEATGISPEKLMDSKIIPHINKQTYLKIQEDKESIQLISLNGIVFASKLGKRGVALGPIFDQITKTGDFATNRMEYLLAEMAAGELALNLQALEMFSKQAIDLIDRNLFERSADIRWWSTDSYFWEALENPSEKKYERACNRLKVINNSYTMYRNLILTDSSGEIVACSKMELRNELKKINVSDQEWFQNGMRTQTSMEYAVQDIQKSVLEKNKDRSLIYSAGIRCKGARSGDSIGVLGVLFDWDTEAKIILKNCLPIDKDMNFIEGCAAFYTSRKGKIMETTDPVNWPVGTHLHLPENHLNLAKGESASGPYTHNDLDYIMGSSRTKGYREYGGLEWSAHVVRPMN